MQHAQWTNCRVIEHPLLAHKLTTLRDKHTSSVAFRRILTEISSLLAYEVSRDLSTRLITVETPLATTQGHVVAEDVLLVSIMRAGNGMLDGFMQMITHARVGHIGIYRDKFINNTVEYYFRLPEGSAGQRAIVLDPLLATGATAAAAIDRLKEYHVGPTCFVCLLASPQGLGMMREYHPDVPIYTLAVEPDLDSKGYIRPGLGDAGERLYGAS